MIDIKSPKTKQTFIFALCALLVITLGLLIFLRSSDALPTDNAANTPTAYQVLKRRGIKAEIITSPQKMYGGLPKILGETEANRLVNGNSLLVKGSITNTEYLRISDRMRSQSWFITIFTLSVDEVIRGELDAAEVQIVSTTQYVGQTHTDSMYECNPTVVHCDTGTEGIFALGAPSRGNSWTIKGKQVYASSLGDFCSMDHYRIDDNTGTLYTMPWNTDLGITVEDLQ